ncbi:ABC transporter permease [Actinoalloteichus sp. GBA129-24]|uniref:ABC transporter permease n=1 Tax=Actinoalloteichus sp. GBA129-24 TaxID=1612551 RepID=UPI0009503833|nr:iron ABC transporter permease [Actinoalloteichus sp. GBA129-24]APU18907.1 ABC-type Fe3+ transport system, permease component [Actinoalloteichus sp. GBA129-24]
MKQTSKATDPRVSPATSLGTAAGPPSRRHGRSRRLGLLAAAALPVGFLLFFFAWPVVAILLRGLGEGGLAETLFDVRTWRIVGFTLGQAAAATLVAVLAGLPLAYLLSRLDVPGRGLIRVLVTVPFVLPTVVVGIAFRALLGDGSLVAIVLANAFFNVAVVVRTVGGLWSHLDRRAEDAARALGASRLRAFTSVTLPALRPALGSAAAVVFLFCSTSFGVVLVLGGARFRTLETEIYLRTVQLLDLPGAAALSLIQLAAVVAALAAGAAARRRRETALRLRPAADTLRRPRGGDWLVVGAALSVLIGLLIPVVTLVIRSLSTSEGFGFAGYRALAGEPADGVLAVSALDAAMNSLRAATDATMLAMVFGVLASIVLARTRRRGLAQLLDGLLMLPLGVSAVTVGFGYLITLGSLPDELRGSSVLVPFVQALVITPLVIRMLLPVLRAVDERLRQAAASLGASPWRVWREVDLPMAARSLIASAAFGFVVALGEFGATSFLVRAETMTLPVAVARLISRPGELNTMTAYAACTLLILVTAAMVAIVERIRIAGGPNALGEF